ncbi:histidine kinase [Gordonia sp. CPCC 206044]|uniref:sensor histidine kinase n=1 Tax=Gordonia sp. CPCC 206044 TaxID=3140793 RepID=UPI003AF3ED73
MTRIRWIDWLIVTALVVVIVLGTPNAPVAAGTTRPGLLAILIGTIGALTLVCWRALPVVPAVAVPVAVFTYLALGYPGGPVLLIGPVAMALVGFAATWRVALGAACAMTVAVVAGQLVGIGELGGIGIAGPAWAFALAAGGQLVAMWSERAAAQRERVRMLERQAVDRQRLEIARDLHDSVAHALVTVTVQADVAAKLLDRRPEQARAALAAIRQAGADVLDDLGAILGALRDDAAVAERLPARRLADVGELADRARDVGSSVDLVVDGDLTSVPSAISGAGYRLVQEALSNVAKHAGRGARVTVSVVVAGPRTVTVHVVDDGGSVSAGLTANSGAGLGLIGMRERVVLTGGTFSAGRRTGGSGFEVRAVWE